LPGPHTTVSVKQLSAWDDETPGVTVSWTILSLIAVETVVATPTAVAIAEVMLSSEVDEEVEGPLGSSSIEESLGPRTVISMQFQNLSGAVPPVSSYVDLSQVPVAPGFQPRARK